MQFSLGALSAAFFVAPDIHTTSTTKHSIHEQIVVDDGGHDSVNYRFVGVPVSYNTAGINPLKEGIQNWLLVPPANAAQAQSVVPPSEEEVKLLNDALSALYGSPRSAEKALPLLNDAVTAWERQADDERAALFRVRADALMELLRPEEAIKDYDAALVLLDGPGGKAADPAEIPAAHLGRARAIMSRKQGGAPPSREEQKKAADDYFIYLKLSSREDWDTEMELVEDGASRNPFAAWEMGKARRGAGDYTGAAEAHTVAADAFDSIADYPRGVISRLDAGIDLAAAGKFDSAKSLLERTIKSTTSIEGRDVELLERVIAKEGEARIALASILWVDGNDKPAAEAQLGVACERLEQLAQDSADRNAAKKQQEAPIKESLNFSIDDIPTAGEVSCSRFKNTKFLTESVLWPENLQDKVLKLTNLKR